MFVFFAHFFLGEHRKTNLGMVCHLNGGTECASDNEWKYSMKLDANRQARCKFLLNGDEKGKLVGC